MITPPTLTPGEAVKIFFKPQLIQDACSYTIPEDSDEEEEQEAYRERAGRAILRLKESHGAEWIRLAPSGGKPSASVSVS